MKTEHHIRKTLRILSFTLTGFVLISCSSGDGSTKGGGLRLVFSAEQIANTSVINAYEAITQLQPYFLRTTPSSTSTQPTTSSTIVVYVDGIRQSDISYLRDIAANNIQQIEYLDGKEAVARFGIGHTEGAINVTMKKQ